MKKQYSIVMLFLFGLIFSSLMAVTLSEGFEENVLPPDGWTMSYSNPEPPSGDLMTISTDQEHSGTHSFRFSSFTHASNGMYDQYLVTPLLNMNTDNTTFSFWYSTYYSGIELFQVGWSSTNNEPDSFTWSEEISASDNDQWTQYVKTDVPIGTQYLAIHYYSNYQWYLYVDDFIGPDLMVPDVDMKAVSITGNPTPSIGLLSTYTITVKNMGNLPADGYSVKLMGEGDVEIASVTGNILTSGAVQSYFLHWTPSTENFIYLYGKVVMTGDMNDLNNDSSIMDIAIQPEGTYFISLGSGDSTVNTIPVDMYYKTSISETIYPALAINFSGLLTGLAWHNTFITQLEAKPTQIWVGETTQTDLNNGWIPSTDLTSVFDGTVDYPIGNNIINIHFTTPYIYHGGNLVIMAKRPLDSIYFNEENKFYVSEGEVGCSREHHSDTIVPDPAAPPIGTAINLYPNVSLCFLVDGGSITGTVTTINTPLQGATVRVPGEGRVSITDASGIYLFDYLPSGMHEIIIEKHGYETVTAQISITEHQITTQDFSIVLLPLVTVIGHVEANIAPGVGIEGATINLTGYEPYTAVTNANGDFTITGVFSNQTYNYSLSATGFHSISGSFTLGESNFDLGTLIVTEFTYPASHLIATLVDNNINLTWTAPDPNSIETTEGFEGTFLPPDWSQIITNTGDVDDNGMLPTWCQLGFVNMFQPAAPHEGENQAGLRWSYNHQDEWLITPQFTCPQRANLTFWSYCKQGSTSWDHYYVKASTDNGVTWTVLWDASTLPILQNCYNTPYVISLDAYADMQIKLAWQAVDGPNMDGIWYDWFIDDITIGNVEQRITFQTKDLAIKSASQNTSKLARIKDSSLPTTFARNDSSKPVQSLSQRNETRPVIGYKVYRLHVGEEINQAVWTQITPVPIASLSYTDQSWSTLPQGDYEWALVVVYTWGESSPIFSNHYPVIYYGTLTGTVTSGVGHVPIEGATVIAGTFTANTNDFGVYSMQVQMGTYNVSCIALGYAASTHDNVEVDANPAVTTENFELEVGTEIFTDGFEFYPDFSTQFSPWTVIDVDESITYDFAGHTWQHAQEAQAFIIFNPTSVIPPLANAGAHLGLKYAACFADFMPGSGGTGPNNDWLILPRVTLDAWNNVHSVSFWAKSFTAMYGLERLKVGVSTTGILPPNFTMISGANYVEVPASWTNYTFDLSAYQGQNVYVAIQCVSNDAMLLMIDDVSLGSVGNEDHVTIPYVTKLDGNYPNPFNPTTIIKYSVKQISPVSITIFNLRGQKVKTLVNDIVTAGEHSVSWNGTDDNNKAVSSGVYFYKMKAGTYSSTKKMILMK